MNVAIDIMRELLKDLELDIKINLNQINGCKKNNRELQTRYVRPIKT